MTITGGYSVSVGDDIDPVVVAKGVRSCLTYGLALACDAVFEDGKVAFGRIEELSATLGVEEVLAVIKESPGSLGKLKSVAVCSLPGMDTAKMRMMVFQLHMFRMMQDAAIRNAGLESGC